jgi:hypothetical protein
MTERAMLMQLVEAADSVQPDWEDALRRAGYLRPHFPPTRERLRAPRVLVLVALALAVIYVVSAVAADKPRPGIVYWLFDRSDETYPVEQVPTLGEWVYKKRATFDSIQTKKGLIPEVRAVPVIQGTVARHRFEMQAFFKQYLRVGFSAGGPAEKYYGTGVPSLGAVNSGFLPVYGLEKPLKGEEFHWISFVRYVPGPIRKGGGTGPKWLFGVAHANVSRVDLEDENNGTVVSVPTFAGPSDQGVQVQLWIAVLRLDHLVHTVVPRDKEGDALEHWRLPIAQ